MASPYATPTASLQEVLDRFASARLRAASHVSRAANRADSQDHQYLGDQKVTRVTGPSQQCDLLAGFGATAMPLVDRPGSAELGRSANWTLAYTPATR